MKNTLILLLLLACASCMEQNAYTRYYENGKLESTYSKRNGLLHGLQTSYYPNGKIYRTHNWIDGKEEGWSNTYDMSGVVIEKSYFIHNNYYSIIRTTKSKCSYIYLRPYIDNSYEYNLHKVVGDSISLKFFIPDSLLSLKNYSLKQSLLINGNEDKPISTIYPIAETNFIYLDGLHFVSGYKYKLTIEPLNPCDNKNCDCDTIDIEKGEKIISIY